MKRSLTTLLAALALSIQAAVAQVGIFSLPNESSLSAPVKNQTVVWDQTLQRWVYFNGSTFVATTYPLSNLTATTTPGTGNDNTQGYSDGSLWINTSTSVVYICSSAATGAAVWNSIVTSVALSVPSWLSVSGSPIGSSGTFTISSATITGNQFIASPNGTSGALGPRAIVPADLPVITLALGGLNANNAVCQGCILYGTASAYVPGPLGTAGQPLLSGGTSPYTFGTLGLQYGGSGTDLSSASDGAISYISGGATITVTPTATNQILQWNGSLWNPTTIPSFTTVTTGHVIGGGSAPTVAVGSGAGASGTASVVGTDTDGIITINTNAADTPAASSTIITVTFASTWGAAPTVIIMPTNDAADNLAANLVRCNSANTTTTQFLFTAGATSLPATTTATYKFAYHCAQ
jgi:hypothetical protein